MTVSPSHSMHTSSSFLAFSDHLAGINAEYQRLLAENEELREAFARCTQSAKDETISAAAGLFVEDEGRSHWEDSAREQQEAMEKCGESDKLEVFAVKHVLQPAQTHAAPPKEAAGVPDRSRRGRRTSVASVRSEFSNDSDPTAPQQPLRRRQSFSLYENQMLIGDMKSMMKAKMMASKQAYDVTDNYKNEGICQFIARHPRFEHVTMLIIGLYALWMAIDTDNNKAALVIEADLVFQVGEHFFCFYFATELLIRFCAFEQKCKCLVDAWFVFDFALVCTMVAETWILTLVVLVADNSGVELGFLSNVSMLRLARLMRLSRLLRMARLLKIVPELLIMIKAIAVACRSVGFTLMLLILVLYVFAIAFTALLKETPVGKAMFSSVAMSMHNLVMYGTFLDEVSEVMRSFLETSYLAFVLMYVFIILSAVTIMNMLIGVLCEVITSVASAEREFLQVQGMRETLEACMGVDENGDGFVDKTEFIQMLDNDKILQALQDLEVDVVALIDYQDVLFEDGVSDDGRIKYKMLSMDDFMDELMQFRGTNTATVKDIVDLRKWIRAEMDKSKEKSDQILRMFKLAESRFNSDSSQKPLDEVASGNFSESLAVLREIANGTTSTSASDNGQEFPNVPLPPCFDSPMLLPVDLWDPAKT